MSAHNENLVIVIPARKNSKRLQSKNLKHFYGFPLFEWSLAAGLFLKQKLSNFRKIAVVCTSDDDEVLNLVKKKYSSSVQAVRRKPELSDDNSVLSDVIIDCIYRLASENVIRLDDYLHGRYILLQPTSPVRLKYDLICFNRFFSKDHLLKYFYQAIASIHNETVFVIKNIHTNPDFWSAWEEIKSAPSVKVTIDTFYCGLVFFRKEQEKEHFTIRV